MPQLTNLVLKDRQATPVDHTFTPVNISNGVAEVNETTGVPLGNNRVTISLKKSSGGRYKAVVNFTFPVVATATINGIATPTVVRTSYASLSFDFNQESSEAERNNIVGMVADSLGVSKTLINDVVVKLQGVY